MVLYRYTLKYILLQISKLPMQFITNAVLEIKTQKDVDTFICVHEHTNKTH